MYGHRAGGGIAIHTKPGLRLNQDSPFIVIASAKLDEQRESNAQRTITQMTAASRNTKGHPKGGLAVAPSVGRVQNSWYRAGACVDAIFPKAAIPEVAGGPPR